MRRSRVQACRPPRVPRPLWWASTACRWRAYREINRRFADRAAAEAAKEAVVWVQDYQLQLVPALLRARRHDLRIGFFNHIPFPGYEIYSRLPWRRQVVEGLLGSDLIGF